MVIWVQWKHAYESIRAGKKHLVTILHIFVWWYLVFPGIYLLTQLAYFCPSTVWFWHQVLQQKGDTSDRRVAHEKTKLSKKEGRENNPTECFLATHPFPGKMRSCISAAVEKAQARCGVQCQCIDSQDRMCAQELSNPRRIAAQKRWWGFLLLYLGASGGGAKAARAEQQNVASLMPYGLED